MKGRKLASLLLAGITTTAMLTGTVQAAEPPTPQELAAARLQSEGLMKGDENGELHLEDSLTRAELACLISPIVLNPEHVAWETDWYTRMCTTNFNDVPEWAQVAVGVCASIPASRPNAAGNKPRCKGKQRVAAYCRVSTDSEEQLNSYTAQKAYYTQKIEDSPDWEMAGIFADEGITGTSMKKRKEFNRMIAACKRGGIDLILTKSLSRFARNTVDCLETVRMLKARGIGVIFEKENINTLTESSEFLITLFSGFAQAESESLSVNIQLGIRMAMKEGKVNFHYKSMLGYRRGADGKPEIVPEEAEVVRRIYRRYLEGCSEGQIQRELTQAGVATAKGVKAWSHQIVHNILTNEKYAGDALLQKTFTTDCISKKVKKNTGELPQYTAYLEEHLNGFPHYDDEIVRKMIERVTVVDAETIRVKFRYSDLEIEQTVR